MTSVQTSTPAWQGSNLEIRFSWQPSLRQRQVIGKFWEGIRKDAAKAFIQAWTKDRAVNQFMRRWGQLWEAWPDGVFVGAPIVDQVFQPAKRLLIDAARAGREARRGSA